VFGVQLNVSIASATNETRAFPKVGRERRIQARELVGFSDAYWESAMVRTVVEEVATLASLALFLGMVAIWAQVIATL
jgi:hypothetical protein